MSRSLKFLIIYLLLTLGLATFVFTHLKELNLIPLPENLTELYFQDHQDIPSSFTPNQPLSFKFAIHNLEHQLQTYQYAITLETASQSAIVASGSAMLSQNELRTFTQSITPSISTRSAVVVSLINPPQSISFWLEPPNPSPKPTPNFIKTKLKGNRI